MPFGENPRTPAPATVVTVPSGVDLKVDITAADAPNNDLTEACVDSVVLRTYSSLPTIGVWGATTSGATARLFVDGPPNKPFEIRSASASQGGTSVPGIAGLVLSVGMAVDANACVGWGHRYQVLARAGYHYASLAIESERAEAMLDDFAACVRARLES